MKKMFSTVAVAASVLATFAEPVTEIHDGFETAGIVVKSTDKYYMHHIQDGWQFTKGPVAFVPKDWLPNGGKSGLLMAMDCSEDDTAKPFVHSGIGSMHAGLASKKGGVHIMRRDSLKPGKYKLSVWTKGTGKLAFYVYNYFGPGDRRMVTTAIGCAIGPSAEWTKTEKIVDCGASVEGSRQATLAIGVSEGELYLDDLDIVPVKE